VHATGTPIPMPRPPARPGDGRIDLAITYVAAAMAHQPPRPGRCRRGYRRPSSPHRLEAVRGAGQARAGRVEDGIGECCARLLNPSHGPRNACPERAPGSPPPLTTVRRRSRRRRHRCAHSSRGLEPRSHTPCLASGPVPLRPRRAKCGFCEPGEKIGYLPLLCGAFAETFGK
jgi:hypothetical protein